MKKEPTRDYATNAFRRYKSMLLREGSLDKYRRRLWDEAVEERKACEVKTDGCATDPTAAAISRAEEELLHRAAEITDYEIVEKTIHTIERMLFGRHRAEALEMVYMISPDNDIGKGDIAHRVHQASLQIPAGEATVYRWLRDARVIFAVERGLSVSEEDMQRYKYMCHGWAECGLPIDSVFSSHY